MSVLQFPHTTASSFSVPSVQSSVQPSYASKFFPSSGSSPFSPFLSLSPFARVKAMSNTGLIFLFALGFCLSYYIGSHSSPLDLTSCYKNNPSEEKSTLNLVSLAPPLSSTGSVDNTLVTNVTHLNTNVTHLETDVADSDADDEKEDEVEEGGEVKSTDGAKLPDPMGVLSAFMTFNRKCNATIPSSEARETAIKLGFGGEDPFSKFPPEGVEPFLRETMIRGWDSSAKVFENLIIETKPEIIIELGSFLGASAIHMANVSKQLGLNPQIFCIDDFRAWFDITFVPKVNGNSMLLYQFMKNVQFFGFEDNILPLPASVFAATLNLCHWGIKADLIEVDAAHDFHSVWMDLHMAHVLLSPKGVMFGHDIVKPEVKRAVKLFAYIKGYRVERQGKHWVYRKKIPGEKAKKKKRSKKTEEKH